LDPFRDASLWNVIDHHLAALRQDPANAERPYAELQVEAVMASVNAGPSSARIPEIVVHADVASLCHGRHGDTLCETIDGVSVPVTTVQRLCCEAIIQAVIVNPDGTVDQICAEQRTANRTQRRMLAAMYATCAHPHCEVPFSACRIHHIVWWTRGGTTTLANSLPLCERHHHLVHEGGWNLRSTTNDTSPGPDPTAPCGSPTPAPTGHPRHATHPADDNDHPDGNPTRRRGAERQHAADDQRRSCGSLDDRAGRSGGGVVRHGVSLRRLVFAHHLQTNRSPVRVTRRRIELSRRR
jgi:hypothetical protein